jgi:predicted nucleotidyltransferase
VPTDFVSLFAILNTLGVRYVVVGGVAALLHGVGRTTADVDIAIDLSTAATGDAIKRLTESGYRPVAPVNPQDFAVDATRTRWQHDNSMVVFSLWDPENRRPTVDILLEPIIEFEVLWLGSEDIPLFGTPIRVVSIEHLIKLKQHSGRPQDLADIDQLQRIAQSKGKSQ